ncbi:MAG: CTP synthase [Candidatus Aenigmarchaeota archaeon]|nr:CTP synthase [Candidatus Aenigmarchaeota archaeon]
MQNDPGSGRKTRFIAITGGVVSGLGKGAVTASIGNLLQAQGYVVTPIKIDPYINIDAGTMRPTEHGEVFVLDDGGETDQDLGTYERFLGKNMTRENNMTTGQVYRTVIEKERNLEFDGKCVEVIPHIPQEVERRIKTLGQKNGADFVLIEVGGTVGDYQNVLFLEAIRQMHLKGDPVIVVHVVYLPIPRNLGEMKSKPAQHSVRMLNEVGIQPDFIVARAEKPLDSIRREKLSLFCNVKPECVISDPDLETVYEMPAIFEEQGMAKMILERFGLPYKKNPDGFIKWEGFVEGIRNASHGIRIGIVGKYFDTGDFTLEDSYISVIEAIKHASWHSGARPAIQWIDSKAFEKGREKLTALKDYHGIIVPGGFGGSGVEGKILAIQYCRENGIPYLGLCYGMQLAVVEFARNVCGMKTAHSTELGRTDCPVIDILPEQQKNIEQKLYGGTMRLGLWPAVLKEGTLVRSLYGRAEVKERHRHRYEVNPDYISRLEGHGLVFSGVSPDRRLMEFVELPGHQFFVGTQAHPELLSKALQPHPLFVGFVKACLNSNSGDDRPDGYKSADDKPDESCKSSDNIAGRHSIVGGHRIAGGHPRGRGVAEPRAVATKA